MAKFLLKGLLLVLTILPILAIAESVDLFKKRIVHLCPEINGRLMDGDKPLGGITIERGIAYGQAYESTTTTDPDGYFSMPSHEYETRKPLNPLDEKRVITYLIANIDGEEIKIWHSVLYSLDPIEKVADSLSTLHCDMNSPMKIYSLKYGESNAIKSDVLSMCNLDNLTYKGLY
ncbi:hypothetical protein CW749_26345 [Vibrio sp. vnigr-6D03]|uniref:DUF6795 domain-containing protein n=1 Tax=Vibrio sp. vnigr-6D03 TaxID=2058088 RepID=UPI000C32042A|nr:DUF6795 domain-containing protein [Vibrio sp. vnigr-6D03]PKF76571.1 hypothetical protein CW749_26345 [Vibrio sp. vnigr-6D03]